MEYASFDEVDFDGLRVINPKIIGWIKIIGTNIDYPVLQGIDNDYYLSRNYLDEFATAGSIFLDYRNNVSNDDFLIIYGHRMSIGKMFSDITKYEKEVYFNSHLDGVFYTEHKKWSLRVVGFAKISADNQMVYGNFSRESADYLKNNSMYWRDEAGKRFLLLSTCDAKNKSMRDVLLLIME